METKENVFAKLHRLSCDRDRRETAITEIQRAITVLEQQLHVKQIELQDNHNVKVNVEAKIKALVKEIE
jgi:hypothetical protein